MTWPSSSEPRPAGFTRRMDYLEKHVCWKLEKYIVATLYRQENATKIEIGRRYFRDVRQSPDQFFQNTKHARCLQFNNLSTVGVQEDCNVARKAIPRYNLQSDTCYEGILLCNPFRNAFTV
jgi:hypothetical protein